MITWKNAGLAALALSFAACHRSAPEGSLVLTQTPADAVATTADTVMDLRYPTGSRVVLLTPTIGSDEVRELSRGLAAAGDPCVSWDGRWVYFAGKASETDSWQVYRVDSGGGRPERLTQMPGGAMNPALAAHDELVFSSPVPRTAGGAAAEPAELYGQWPGAAPRRLTFTPDHAVGATVLRDGRILFVTTGPRDSVHAAPHPGLYTINNDGTEITAYAGQDDGAGPVRRPRELGDGRIGFLAARGPGSGTEKAEGVRSAAPFTSRGPLFAWDSAGCSSVEALGNELLVCCSTAGMMGRAMTGHSAVYRVAAGAADRGAPVFDDPRWNTIEAMPVGPRPEPAGHTTAVMPGASRGTVLCLNVDDSSVPAAEGSPNRAASLRVSSGEGKGRKTLGSVPVADDGSVLVYLPVGVALGFDTLDAEGKVLRHQPPFVWLQPGENRGCVGCHELRNHSPRNLRPLAVLHDPAHLESGEIPNTPPSAK